MFENSMFTHVASTNNSLRIECMILTKSSTAMKMRIKPLLLIHSKCFKWVCVFGYAAMAPAGMGLGVVITAMANHPSQTELPFFVPIFQCVAGGAVLYAALAEVSLFSIITDK